MTAWRCLLEHGNSLGLLFDIVGAVLITRYGLPPAVDRGGKQYLITEQTDTAEARKADRYELIGRLGLVLLIIGFRVALNDQNGAKRHVSPPPPRLPVLPRPRPAGRPHGKQ